MDWSILEQQTTDRTAGWKVKQGCCCKLSLYVRLLQRRTYAKNLDFEQASGAHFSNSSNLREGLGLVAIFNSNNRNAFFLHLHQKSVSCGFDLWIFTNFVRNFVGSKRSSFFQFFSLMCDFRWTTLETKCKKQKKEHGKGLLKSCQN